MTDKEREVIEWAFNLAHSIVPGNYGVPKPMCVAINSLQDAVHDLARERSCSIADGCSKVFLDIESEYWKELEEKLKKSIAEKKARTA